MANYLSSTEKEDKEMLQAVGVERFSDLYQDIPFELRNKPLNIPNGKSLQEVSDEMQALADKNVNYACIMRGAGAYDHYIPSIVKYLSQRSEFLTAYTPYQAELSQGILQSIFEFQTMMCSLTGMDVCNASVYDGSSAAAEAAFMCIERSKRTVLVPDNVKPCTIEVIRTYLERRNITVKVLPTNNGLMSIDELGKAITEDTACVYFESPNYFGLIEDCENVCGTIKQHGARAIMGCNPMSLAILRTPKDYGADIAVGDAQPFGMPISFGGPYLGYIAIANDKELIRRIPGRVVGETTDKDGKRAYVLTLRAREQDIRREKALSNICSNEAHCVLTAAMYLTAMGKQGLREVATACTSLAHYAAEEFTKGKATLKYSGEYFNEFVTVCGTKAEKIVEKCEKLGILAGLPIGKNEILWCMTEKVRKEDIDKVAEIMRRA